MKLSEVNNPNPLATKAMLKLQQALIDEGFDYTVDKIDTDVAVYNFRPADGARAPEETTIQVYKDRIILDDEYVYIIDSSATGTVDTMTPEETIETLYANFGFDFLGFPKNIDPQIEEWMDVDFKDKMAAKYVKGAEFKWLVGKTQAEVQAKIKQLPGWTLEFESKDDMNLTASSEVDFALMSKL